MRDKGRKVRLDRGRRTAIRNRLVSICMMIWLSGLLFGVGVGRADEDVMPGKDVFPQGRKTFSECVRLAITQSPFLTVSSLEVQLKRLDEADSKYSLFPSLSLHSRYYFDQPKFQNEDPKPYTLAFVTDGYNPIEAYVTLQAQKLITQIAIYGHLRIISESIHRIASGFLELDALEEMGALQREVVELAERNVDYVSRRVGTGGATPLDSRVAAQDVELANLEGRKIASSKETIQDGLKALLGLPADQVLELDLRDARIQVLDHAGPNSHTLDQARANSYDLKIEALKKELQTRNIKLAYTRFFPTFSLGLQSTDPLSGIDSNGYFFSIGFDLPLWDGLKRYRNVGRQETVLKQFRNQATQKDLDIVSKWKTGVEKASEAAAELKLARTQVELMELKQQQGEIGYQSGRIPFSGLLADKKACLEARKNARIKTLEYDKALLNLRFLSGELSKAYVDAKVM
ncbi:outer membrane efflux protein [Syntrophobacter fumaroxidans MPOB]|uniref:Outer membrane efflux protein n=2 Tax=Syntrophobacter TaxID=29526 RepID=A0LKG2_SYNFM|nr:outer membrane efflux protein [Syntrophobacter fumaroxidans MPOB]